jgi:hypothetical protein
MTSENVARPIRHEPELLGETVVVIRGRAGRWPYYASLAEMDVDGARRTLQEHPMAMAASPATPPASSS